MNEIAPISVQNQTVNYNVENKKKKKTKAVGGTIGALAAGAAINNIAPQFTLLPVLNGMVKAGTLEGEDAKTVHRAVKQMLVDKGLKEKGVRIRFLSPLRGSIKNATEEELRKKPLNKYFKNLIDLLAVNSIREGQNACFIPKSIELPKITFSEYQELAEKGSKEVSKKMQEKAVYIKGNSVLLPKEKLHTAGFHELGHAMNHHFSKIGKFLQYCRPVAKYAPMVLGIYGALSKKSKPKEDGKDLTTAQKTNNFVRNNAGILTFLATTPMLIEEAMASIKGLNYAKKVLSPDLAKRVTKTNAIAYLSYLGTALFGTLAVTTAVKIKDNAIQKKEEKEKLKEEFAKQLNQNNPIPSINVTPTSI